MDQRDNKGQNHWFHTDPQLFKIPAVQQHINSIWENNFQSTNTLARKWSEAIQLTQAALIHWRKEVRSIRIKRRDEIFTRLQFSLVQSSPTQEFFHTKLRARWHQVRSPRRVSAAQVAARAALQISCWTRAHMEGASLACDSASWIAGKEEEA